MKLRLKNSGGYALLLAILPVVMMYKVPGINLGASTVLIILGMIYSALVIIKNADDMNIALILPIVFYLVWAVIKSDFENALLCIAIVSHLTAISTGATSCEKLKKYIVAISCIASACLIAQQLVHLAFGIHIPMIVSEFTLDEIRISYDQAIKTAMGIEKTYRPSAFFLEPAHFTQYCIFGVIFSLFTKKPDYRRALMISAGILFTTSGMGFVLTFAVWGWWYITYFGNDNIMKRIKRVLFAAVTCTVIIAVLAQTKYFGSVISRFLVPSTESGGYNAIFGRLFWWDSYFGGLTWKDLVWGFGSNSLPDRYFTGFMTILYAFGIVGVLLFIVAVINIIAKGTKLSRTISFIYLGLLFVANLTGFLYIIFQFGVMISNIVEDKSSRINPEKTHAVMRHNERAFQR